MPFPIPRDNDPSVIIPVRATERWRLREKLAENAELVLAMPIGPLITIQFMMATTAKQHIWDQKTNQAVCTGVDLEPEHHLKLLKELTDRLLPRIKSIDQDKMNRAGEQSQDALKNLPMDELNQRLAKLEAADATKPEG